MLRQELLLASVEPASADEAARTVDCCFYSGAAIPRYDWYTDEMYTLSFSMEPGACNLDRLTAGAPVIDSHNTWSVLNQFGVCLKAWIDGGKGMATLQFSRRDATADGVWKDVQDGIIKNLSMGAFINQVRDITAAGDENKSILAVDWQPYEISILPVGADLAAQILGFDLTQAPVNGAKGNLPKLQQYLAKLQASIAPPPAPIPDPVQPPLSESDLARLDIARRRNQNRLRAIRP